MKAIIYDYETLSSEAAEAPILALSIYRFESDRFITNPYTLEEIIDGAGFYKFDIAEQIKKFGRKISQDTLEWWGKQDKEVKEQILNPKSDDISVTELRNIFESYYQKDDLAFTRGNTFDPIITHHLLKAMGMDPNFHHFAAIRDTRSYIEGMSYGSGLSNSFTPPELEGKTINKHDPRVDIALDILRIQAIARSL